MEIRKNHHQNNQTAKQTTYDTKQIWLHIYQIEHCLRLPLIFYYEAELAAMRHVYELNGNDAGICLPISYFNIWSDYWFTVGFRKANQNGALPFNLELIIHMPRVAGRPTGDSSFTERQLPTPVDNHWAYSALPVHIAYAEEYLFTQRCFLTRK